MLELHMTPYKKENFRVSSYLFTGLLKGITMQEQITGNISIGSFVCVVSSNLITL